MLSLSLVQRLVHALFSFRGISQVESILKQKSADISLVLDGPCNLSNAWTILRPGGLKRESLAAFESQDDGRRLDYCAWS